MRLTQNFLVFLATKTSSSDTLSSLMCFCTLLEPHIVVKLGGCRMLAETRCEDFRYQTLLSSFIIFYSSLFSFILLRCKITFLFLFHNYLWVKYLLNLANFFPHKPT